MTVAFRPTCGQADFFATCDLVPWTSATHEHPDDRFCRWCGTTELPGRRSTWCTDEHRNEWLANHFWQWARPRALKRRQSCEVCGAGPWMSRLAAEAFNRDHDLQVRDWFEAGRYRIVPVGTFPWDALDYSRYDRDAIVAMLELEAFANANILEVDHRVPLLATVEPYARPRPSRWNPRPRARSRHGRPGCHHHQSNLQVLCREHHVEKTRADKRAARVDARQAVLA